MELKYILKHFRINIDKCPKLVVLGGDAVIEKDEFGNFHSQVKSEKYHLQHSYIQYKIV